MHAKGNPARRTSVAKHPSVYYRVGADGKRNYEITFLDSNHDRRWRVIRHGNLEDAQRALDDIRQLKNDGKLVLPRHVTVEGYGAPWIEGQHQLRHRTKKVYEANLRTHVYPVIGRRQVGDVKKRDVLAVLREMQRKGRADWTQKGALNALRQLFDAAVDEGVTAVNPVRQLSKKDLPKANERLLRILEDDEVERLLAAASERYRPLLATAIYSGLRQGELLGLLWSEVDFERGYIHVNASLDRATRQRGLTKTAGSARKVVMMPALGRVLRAHQERSQYRGAGDPVFATEQGGFMHYRNVTARAFEAAVKEAGLNQPGLPKVRWHDMRHVYASQRIRERSCSIQWLADQMGHCRPSITQDRYGHLLGKKEQDEEARAAMESAHGNVLETTGGERRLNEVTEEGGKVVDLSQYRATAHHG